MDVEALTRQVVEQERKVVEATKARNRAQENAYVEERKLAALRHKLSLAKAGVTEGSHDSRQLLNG